jgi:hypothetical protein
MCSCTSCGVAFLGKDSGLRPTNRSMRRSERRSRLPQFRSCVRAFQVRSSFGGPPCQRRLRGHGDGNLLDILRPFLYLAEEFAIYMNYVRKLGFEESPDYDFLRELFAKVLKNIGEQDDGIYDWMLLHNGKGWEAGKVCDSPTIANLYIIPFSDRRLRCWHRHTQPRPHIHLVIAIPIAVLDPQWLIHRHQRHP